MLENFKNLYEVRKVVRFELKPYKKTRKILKGENNYEDLNSYIKHIKDGEFKEGFNWNIFCISEYENFLIESEKYFLLLQFINKNQKKSLFFDFKKSKGIFKNIPSLKNIAGIKSLKQKFKEIEKEYKNYFDFFEKIKNIKEKNIKKSDISIYLRKIAYLNRNLFTIFNFFDIYKTDKEILDKYEKIKNNINFEKINNSIIASHENEVSGACFGRFTLNKFSLFRRETKFLKEKFENNKKLLQKNVNEMIIFGIFNDNGEKIDIKLETINSLKLKKENGILKERVLNFNFERNIDEVISELDYINSELLKQYIEEFKNNYKKNKNIISGEFEKFSENGEEKNNYHKKANISLNDVNIEIKPKRGQTLEGIEYLELLGEQLFEEKDKENQKLANKFLQILFREKKLNPDYNIIKDFRDKLSEYRGKLRQNLRVSEREFIQESMIKYYGQILEKDGNYFLILFDKNNLDNDIKNIDKELKFFNDKENLKNYFKIYKYSQLSFSALEKLCLSEDGDLIKNKNLIKKWNKYKNQKKDIDVKCELFYKDKTKHGIKTKGRCEECKNKTEIEKEIFFEDFKEHILLALKNLENNEKYKGENWLELLEGIEKQNSIEEIVNFINQNFYKLEYGYIGEDNIYDLSDSGKILLFQIYNKDFNILNENFISEEENINENEKNIGENTKTIDKTKREKGKQENLFTIYFKNIFKKDLETFLGQEGGLFFRKANLENDKKRFKNNKFFISFDIIFNKGKQNHNGKLCEKKDNILEKHIKNTTLNIFNKVKDKKEIIILGIDRGSISESISEKSKISMIGYSIIKLEKNNNKYILKEILESGDINLFFRGKKGWEIIGKGENLGSLKSDYIDPKKILSDIKKEINKEIQKNGVKRELFKMLNKKEGITSLLVSSIIGFIGEYNIDYIALENLDNIFTDNLSYKKYMENNTLSSYIYQNFETQLFKKLNYIIIKDNLINDKQRFPIIGIDDIKNLTYNKFFKNYDNENFEEYKILGNIIFIKTARSSSSCINCDSKINKHSIKCDNCKIFIKNNGNKLDLKNYKEYFILKNILEKQNIQKNFNNDARAGFFIAKKAKEYLENLIENKNQ